MATHVKRRLLVYLAQLALHSAVWRKHQTPLRILGRRDRGIALEVHAATACVVLAGAAGRVLGEQGSDQGEDIPPAEHRSEDQDERLQSTSEMQLVAKWLFAGLVAEQVPARIGAGRPAKECPHQQGRLARNKEISI